MRLTGNNTLRIASWLGTVLSLMLCSCIDDNSLCPDETTQDKKEMTVEFTMVTRNADGNNRSEDGPKTDNPAVGFPAENYLDLDNMMFLIFDNNLRLIKPFYPEVSEEPSETKYAKYNVKFTLTEDYFLYPQTSYLDFTVVVIGNYSKLSPQNIYYRIGQRLESIFNQETGGTFAMPISNNSTGSWIPSIFGTTYTDAFGNKIEVTSSAHIPMAGMQTFKNVSVVNLKNSTKDTPLQLSGGTATKFLHVLRSLAKIEIVDCIDALKNGAETFQPATDDRISIEKVELMGYTSRGSIFPTYNQWTVGGNVETQYVTNPSIPSDASYIGVKPKDDLSLSATSTYKPINFFADSDASLRSGYKVFSCYLTEYDSAKLDGKEPIWMRVTARIPVAEGSSESKKAYYRINLSSYENGESGENISVLRNNIYRYVITSITPEDQQNGIKFTVCPVDEYETDVPAFQ